MILIFCSFCEIFVFVFLVPINLTLPFAEPRLHALASYQNFSRNGPGNKVCHICYFVGLLHKFITFHEGGITVPTKIFLKLDRSYNFPTKIAPVWRAPLSAPHHLMTLNPPSSLALLSPINIRIMARHHILFPLTPRRPSLFTCFQQANQSGKTLRIASLLKIYSP